MQLSDFAAFNKRGGFPADYDSNFLSFFSPFDDIHGLLLAAINGAKQSIVIGIYGLDDPEIVAALIAKAKDPAIFVQINADKVQAASQTESPLITELKTYSNTRVAVGQSENHLINHVKLMVVDALFKISGSTNWSAGGEGSGDGKHGQNNELVVTMSRVAAAEATHILNTEHQEMLAQMAA